MKPWEKRSGESPQAYQAFLIYRDMEPGERAIRKAAKELTKSETLLRGWSAKHEWRARCKAWDAAEQKRRDAALMKSKEEHARRRAQLGSALQTKGIIALQKFDTDKATIRDIVELLRLGIAIEDDALGLLECRSAEKPGKVSTSSIKLYDSSVDLDRV